MEFTLAHVLCVTHEEMFVSTSELTKFLSYMCGRRLEILHLAAASQHCVLALVEQFPFVDRLALTALKTKLNELRVGYMSRGEAVPLEVIREIMSKWVEDVRKRYKIPEKIRVKTLAEMKHRPFSEAAYTAWWWRQRMRKD